MDLLGGRREIDEMEGKWVEPIPRNFLEKVCVFLSFEKSIADLYFEIWYWIT